MVGWVSRSTRWVQKKIKATWRFVTGQPKRLPKSTSNKPLRRKTTKQCRSCGVEKACDGYCTKLNTLLNKIEEHARTENELDVQEIELLCQDVTQVLERGAVLQGWLHWTDLTKILRFVESHIAKPAHFSQLSAALCLFFEKSDALTIKHIRKSCPTLVQNARQAAINRSVTRDTAEGAYDLLEKLPFVLVNKAQFQGAPRREQTKILELSSADLIEKVLTWNLNHLTLNSIALSPQHCEQLAAALPNMLKLSKLSLVNCGLNTELLQILRPGLQNVPLLKGLDLSGNMLSQDGTQVLEDCLTNASTLTSLSLALTDVDLGLLFPQKAGTAVSKSKLTELNLASNRDLDIDALSRCLESNKTTLKTLDLSNTKLASHHLPRLIGYIADMPCLIYLSLAVNFRLFDEASSDDLQKLASGPALRELDLSGCAIAGRQCVRLFTNVSNCLTDLILEDNDIGSLGGMTGLPCLRYINVRSNLLVAEKEYKSLKKKHSTVVDLGSQYHEATDKPRRPALPL